MLLTVPIVCQKNQHRNVISQGRVSWPLGADAVMHLYVEEPYRALHSVRCEIFKKLNNYVIWKSTNKSEP